MFNNQIGNTLSEYDISASAFNYTEVEASTEKRFHTGKAAMLGLALITTSLHLSNIPPAQLIDRYTAKSLVEPYAKDQLINTKRQDIKMLTRVRELASYPAGWDNFDAQPPSKKAVDEAEKFIASLSAFPILEPHISLAADGEINFYWKNKDFLLDLGFFGDGLYSYYAKTSSGKEYTDDDIPVEDPLPETIKNLIAK